MTTFSVLAIYLVTALSLKCSGEKYETCRDNYMYEKRCFKDGSGYADYDCIELSELTGKDADAKTYVWSLDKKYGKTTRCNKPNSACRCFELNFWNWYEQNCECYNPTPTPKFPKIGIIRWNGTFINEDYYGISTTIKTGEVHKNSNGHYLKKEWSAEKKSMVVEMLIPNDEGSFTEYTGDSNNKLCKVETGKPEKTLLSIWQKFANDNGVDMKTERRKKGSTSIQTWGKNDNQGDWEHDWSWTVKYDKKKDEAIPISYYYKYTVYPEDISKEVALEYIFEPLNEGDVSFQLEEFCNNA